jgi:hypothetical protein
MPGDLKAPALALDVKQETGITSKCTKTKTGEIKIRGKIM